ncbi:MAG: hypothetical protein ACAI34_10725 [Verrucomicrobium sp.]|nr:hypothetical protein [Verrucomicrobium sp.]
MKPLTLLAASLLLFAQATFAADKPQPLKAEIVPVAEETKDWWTPIGNVKVTFTDGHSEMWTKQGQALLPKVSVKGAVGWTKIKERSDKGEPVNSVLRVLLSETEIKDLEAGPFIEAWDFANEGATVVVKSRARHGPANFRKFDLQTAKELGNATTATPYKELPEWAKPYADDVPDPAGEAKKKP